MILSRRQFLQTSAAAVSVFSIVRAESLMNIWVPPEKQIITDTTPFNFILGGVRPGSTVSAKASDGTTVFDNEMYTGEPIEKVFPRWSLGEVRVFIRHPIFGDQGYVMRTSQPVGEVELKGVAFDFGFNPPRSRGV